MRSVTECVWLQVIENPTKGCLNLAYHGQMPYLLTPQHVLNAPFSYCVIISMLYNWKCRSKTVNTDIQQHPQGPRFVLSFSFAILRLLSAFVLKLVFSGSSCDYCNNTSFAHTAASRDRRGCHSSFTICFIREKRYFQKFFSPRQLTFMSCWPDLCHLSTSKLIIGKGNELPSLD